MIQQFDLNFETRVESLAFKLIFFFSHCEASVSELRGECEPFQFTLDPPAIFVPGSTYMHSTTRKSFRVFLLLFKFKLLFSSSFIFCNHYLKLINMSICPISFNWKQVLDSSVIQVEPSYGEIGSFASFEMKKKEKFWFWIFFSKL